MTISLDDARRVAEQVSPLPQVAHEALQVLLAELDRMTAAHDQIAAAYLLFDVEAQAKIVHSEQDGDVPPEVQDMLANPGIYVLGDTRTPGITIPIVSVLGQLYSVRCDAALNPQRFLPSVTINGPFLSKVVANG